jgi:hypothetical protein
MPKEPSALYNHNARKAIAHQLNLSTNPSGCSSFSYTSSQVPLECVVPEVRPEDECSTVDPSMDIDEDHVIGEDLQAYLQEQVVEVMPGINVKTKLKAKQYDNSVSFS